MCLIKASFNGLIRGLPDDRRFTTGVNLPAGIVPSKNRRELAPPSEDGASFVHSTAQVHQQPLLVRAAFYHRPGIEL